MNDPIEIIEARTLSTKTFNLGGRKRRLICSTAPIHYDDAGQLKNVDTAIFARGADLVAENLPFLFKLDGVGYRYESRRGGAAHVRLVQIDGRPFDRFSVAKQVTANRVLFPDVATDVDIEIRVGKVGVRVFTILKTPEAPRRFLWHITQSNESPFTINYEATGRDANHRQLNILNTVVDRAGTETTIEKGHRIDWTGEVRVVDPITRIPSWGTNPVYPLRIDPDITEEIVLNSDDGTEVGGTWTDAYVFAGIYSYVSRYPGLRFQSVAVPQGATIDLANLVMKVTARFNGPLAAGFIYGVDADDTATWGSGNKPSGQVKTTAKTAWNDQGTTCTYNVTAIIQEIVDRGGWVSGNDLSLILWHSLGGYGKFLVWEDYNDAGTDEPFLEIDYTAGAGTFTASSAITISNQTLSSSATFSPGTKTASSSLSTGNQLLASTATHTTPSYIATSSLTVSQETLASTATHTTPSYIATSSLTASQETLASTATHTTPTYTATSSLTVSQETLASTATHTTPTYTATSSLTSQQQILASSAIFATSTFIASSSLSSSQQLLSSSASHIAPTYTASSSISSSQQLLASSASHVPPSFISTSILSTGNQTLTSSATFSSPSFIATSLLTISPQLLISTANNDPSLSDATSTLTASSQQLSSTATFIAQLEVIAVAYWILPERNDELSLSSRISTIEVSDRNAEWVLT